jgi:foldase protein PrsA
MNNKRIISTLGSIFIIFLLFNCFFIKESKSTQLNAIDIYLNGSKINISTILDKGELYVSLNGICKYFNCDYDKDDNKKTINFIRTQSAKEKQDNTDVNHKKKETGIKIEKSDYQTMINGIDLFISPLVYEDIFYIPLEQFSESFEKSTKWNLFKTSILIKDYPEEYVGSINGEKIKKRFFNERYYSKYQRMNAGNFEKDNKKKPVKISKEMESKLKEDTFNEISELIIIFQKAKEFGLVIDEDIKRQINYYLAMTIDKFGGINNFRKTFGKNGITYQDAINYFTYGVVKEVFIEKMASGIEPPEDMMRAYFENSPKTFTIHSRAIVKQIILPIKDKDENSFNDEKIAEQKDLADMILKKIRNGENFDLLRQKYSQDYYTDTKDHPDGFVVEEGALAIAKVFEDAVFKLKPGEISDVVKTYRGYHIIKLISKTEAKQKTFEESKEKIKKDLAYTAKVSYMDELLKKWKDDSVIKKEI